MTSDELNVRTLISTRFDTSSIAVVNYTGWGVTGTNLLFKPEGVFNANPATRTLTLSPPPEAHGIHVPSSQHPTAPSGSPLSTALGQPTPPVVNPNYAPSNQQWKVIVGATLGVCGTLAIAAAVIAAFVLRRRGQVVHISPIRIHIDSSHTYFVLQAGQAAST